MTLAGADMKDKLEALGRLDPQLARCLVRDGFGGVLADATNRSPRMGAVYARGLIAIGDAGDQLEVYTEAALRHGVTPDERLLASSSSDAEQAAP